MSPATRAPRLSAARVEPAAAPSFAEIANSPAGLYVMIGLTIRDVKDFADRLIGDYPVRRGMYGVRHALDDRYVAQPFSRYQIRDSGLGGIHARPLVVALSSEALMEDVHVWAAVSQLTVGSGSCWFVEEARA